MVVTGDRIKASLPLLEGAPDLEVGLHLVLTGSGERPLAGLGLASGLVGRDGQFLSNGRMWVKAWTGKLSRAAVADEMAAQAEAFEKFLGRLPAYVDAHHHAHQLPIIREALVELTGAGVLPAVTRLTIEPPGMLRRVAGVRIKRAAADFLGKSAAGRFGHAGIVASRHYFGMIGAAELSREWPWSVYFGNLPLHGVVEWVVHPGESDDELAGRDSYVLGRTRELAALVKPANRCWWDRPGIVRTTKGALYTGART
jgi:predicted glycoside hydrolase/deacetylase ChbG (UPF0249 family)